MPLFLVTIQDKALCGEPDIAFALVEAIDEAAAEHLAKPTLDALALNQHCRCRARVLCPQLGMFYRMATMFNLPPVRG